MAEPDIATSVDEEQNSGIIDTVAQNIAEIPEAAAQGLVKAVAEIDDKANAATGGALDTVNEWMNENLFDFGNIGTDADGGIIYYRVAEAMKQAKELGLEDEEFNAYVKDKAQVVNLTDGVKTFTGKMTAGLSQFAVGWLPINRALSVFNTSSKLGKGVKLAAEGAGAEVLAFDKHEARLSNLIEDYPTLANPITAYLAADPNDGTAEAVFKQAVEGVVLEGTALVVIAGVKALRAARNGSEDATSLAETASKEAEKIAPTMGDDLVAELDAFKESNQILTDANEKAATLTGAERAKVRAEGRSESVAAMSDDALADLQSKGGAVNKTQAEQTQAAKIRIGGFFAKYGENTDEALDAILARFGGNEDKAAKFVADAAVVADIAKTKFTNTHAAYQAGEASYEDAMTAFVRAITAINYARGGVSSAGRALDFSKVINGWEVNTMEVALKTGAFLQQDLKAQNKFFASLGKYATSIKNGGSRAVGMVNELFINSILSGFKTHLVNIGSNTYTMLTMPMEKAIGAAITGNRADMMKALRMYQGFAYGSLASAKGAFSAIKSGATKLDADYSILEDGKMMRDGYIPNWMGGGVIRAPTRLLAAEDEFFKQINFRAFVYSEAVTAGRALIKEGKLDKSQLSKYVDGEVDKAVNIQMEQAMNGTRSTDALAPTADAAIQYGRTATFTQGLDGKISQGISKAVTNFPILRQINPFVRTPLNLLSYTVQRSPLFALSGRWRRDFMSGGTRQGEAITRATVGSGLAYYFYNLAVEDKITGSGEQLSTDQLKGLQDISGYDKNSVVTEEGYVNVQRLSPALDLMTIMASIHELNKFGNKDAADEMIMGVTMVITEMMRDKSFMQGIDDFFNAIDDPERYGTSYAANRAGALVPYSGLIKSINQELADPKNRKIRTVLDGFYRNTPGLSDELDPHYNILGEEKFIPEFYGVDFASPVGWSELKDNPLADEWKAALEQGLPYNVGMPPLNKDGIDLTDRAFATDKDGNPLDPRLERGTAYGEWMRRTGLIKGKVALGGKQLGTGELTLRQALTALVQSDDFKNDGTGNIRIGDRVYTGTKQQVVKKVINMYRNTAWELMVGKNPYEAGSPVGVFGSDGVLYEHKGQPAPQYKQFPLYQKLSVAYWNNHRNKNYYSQSPEGQKFMNENETQLNNVLTGGNN